MNDLRTPISYPLLTRHQEKQAVLEVAFVSNAVRPAIDKSTLLYKSCGRFRAHEPGFGRITDSSEVEPVDIPASLNRWIIAQLATSVPATSLIQ
jgi:hypothetical protein